MTILIILGLIFTLILGFSLSGLLVVSKLRDKNKLLKNSTFLMLGCVFSIFAMAATIFIVWPA